MTPVRPLPASGPQISVVMPCWNAACTIARALDSIQSQTTAAEVVVVDGGSTDGTLELLSQREGIHVVSEPDDGLSDAVNKGVRLAAGPLVGWLNADDAYLPGALEHVSRAFAARPHAEWLIGRCRIVDGEDREIRKAVTWYKDRLLDRYGVPLHLTQNFVPAPSTFFTRDAYLAVGGMDLELRYAMDYDLYLKLGLRSAPIVLPEVLASFTMQPGTLSMSGFERQFVEHQQVAWRHRSASRSAAAVNRVMSRAIVLAYRAARLQRERGGSRS